MLTGDQKKNQQVWAPRASFLGTGTEGCIRTGQTWGLGSNVLAGHMFTVSSALGVETKCLSSSSLPGVESKYS